MKVYRLEFIESGQYEVLTLKELQDQFTNEEIESFTNDESVIFYETSYTTRQLAKARKLYNDQEYCYEFEEQHDFAPTLYDILEAL